MTCRIDFGCKMIILVHQCMKNTLSTNREIFSFRKFSTLQKTLRPVSSYNFSRLSLEEKPVYFGQRRSHAFLKKPQTLVPLSCNLCSKSSNICPKECPNEEKPEAQLSTYGKLKKMFKEYWYVMVPVHLFTSAIWFGAFYYMAASGINIPELLETLGAPDNWVEKLKNSKAGAVVLAYTLYKVSSPLRYAVTLGGTTISINYLKQLGWIKPVPSQQQMKQMYQDQKLVFKDLKDSYMDKMQVTKNELLKTKNEMGKRFEEIKEDLNRSASNTRHGFREGFQEGVDDFKFMARSISKKMNKAVEEIKNDFKDRKRD